MLNVNYCQGTLITTVEQTTVFYATLCKELDKQDTLWCIKLLILLRTSSNCVFDKNYYYLNNERRTQNQFLFSILFHLIWFALMLQLCYSNFTVLEKLSYRVFLQDFRAFISWNVSFTDCIYEWSCLLADIRFEHHYANEMNNERRFCIATVTDSPWYIDVIVRILMISHIIAFAVYDAMSQRKMLLLFGPGNPDESEWWNHPPRRVVCHILSAIITVEKLILWCLRHKEDNILLFRKNMNYLA